MQFKTGVAALSAAVISCGFAARAQAETLLYITPTQFGTVDSSNPGVDTTPGGARTFTLPTSYAIVGADIDQAQPTLINVLARNGTTCQLFTVDPSVSGAIFSATNDSFTCSVSTGDIEFSGDSNGTDGLPEYFVAAGSQVYGINDDEGTAFETISVTAPGGGVANVVGVALTPRSSSSGDHGNYGIDKNSNSLFTLGNSSDGSNSEVAVGALGLTLSGSISFDYSDSSSKFYLLSAGTVYTGTTAGTAFTSIGAAPSGTIAILANFTGSFAAGSGGSTSGTTGTSIISLSASSTSAINGESSALTITVSAATSCVASGDWTGTPDFQPGTFKVTVPVHNIGPNTFNLTCTNADGNASVTITGTTGSGAIGWPDLLAFGAAAALMRRRRVVANRASI